MGYPKYTLEEIRQKLDKNNKGIILIGDYHTKRSKTLFKHVDCGYEWITTLDVVGRLGSGCPMCAREAKKLSFDNIQKRLASKNILMIGDYISSHHKILFKHSECGHEWFTKPCDLLNGDHSCPKCARHGFNITKSAWTYVFERSNYIKYGVTNNLEQRLQTHRRHGEIFVHHSEYHIDGKKAKEWEINIKTQFGGKYATKDECPDGYTETLPLAALAKLLPK